MKETDLLTEVTWDLSKYINKDEFNKGKISGSYPLGTKRLEDFIVDNGISGLDKVYERLIEFKEYLQTIENQNIIVVSHSFLMKVIYLILVKNLKKEDITAEQLQDTYKPKYLHGFEVEI